MLDFWHEFLELSVEIDHERLRYTHIIEEWTEHRNTHIVYRLCINKISLGLTLGVIGGVLLEPPLETLIPLMDQAESRCCRVWYSSIMAVCTVLRVLCTDLCAESAAYGLKIFFPGWAEDWMDSMLWKLIKTFLKIWLFKAIELVEGTGWKSNYFV